MKRGGSLSGDLAKGRGSRECSAPPVECPSAISSLPEVKRTLSVEALSPRRSKNENARYVPSEGRVTSVLGLFKPSADTTARKRNGGSRAQNVIVNRSKGSPPKCVKSTESSLEEDAVTSKIPTKFARADSKPMRQLPENKRSPEKVASESQRSSPKEKTKENESIAKGKIPFVDKRSRELKGTTPTSPSSADKIKLDKANSSKRKSSDQSSECPRKVVEDKHDAMEPIGENKKLIKTKRNSLSSLVSRNESIAGLDKTEDVKVDKKIKKLVKSKEDATCGKEETDGSRKKRIVRVVRKIVKKSSESKSDEKGKSSKLLMKKETKAITTKEEKSPEGPNVTTRGKEGNGDPDDQTAAKSFCSKRAKSDSPVKKPTERTVENINTNRMKPDIKGARDASDKFVVNVSSVSTDVSRANSQNSPNSQSVSSALPVDSSNPATRIDSSFNICQLKQLPTLEQDNRPSRANLKLDLSKIPQHAFRHATPKRDSPRSDSPKANPTSSSKTDDSIIKSGSDKLMECLSKMTHHANITGNKIVVDKPLRAKDIAELKRDVCEHARIIENHVGSRTVDQPSVSSESKEIAIRREIELNSSRGSDDVNHGVTTEPRNARTSEIFSPEEPEESFDFWSICSADLNHNRGDLHSPMSPSPSLSPSSYSLFMRGDSSESVIDRIRRRSFYSRFNDRKRPSLTAPPPGVSSVTLPRRFSFNGSRERERDKLYYRVPRTRGKDKSYILYSDDDEASSRKSPVEREKYSDTFNVSSYGRQTEARTFFDPYGSGLPSSSHDSRRRYVRSPTLDLVASRAKCYSTDVIADNDLAGISSYKSPLSRSFLSDGVADSSYYVRSTATLPKKYGSTVGGLEPKSVEYYEEILSPNNPEYLSPRDTCHSPLLDTYPSRRENECNHNGNLDLQFSVDKSRAYTDAEIAERDNKVLET